MNPDAAHNAAIDVEELAPRAERLRALGAHIRALRKRRTWSAARLAEECSVSTSMISQVERGLAAPSLDLLWAISRRLDVPMGTFFQSPGADQETPEPPARTIVVRRKARKRLGLTPSLVYQLLSPDLQHQIEFVWIEFLPGQRSPVDPFTHLGEEQQVVIRGEMHFIIDGEDHVLTEGDSITFDSALPHRSENRSNQRAVVIAAITPPSF